MSFPGAGGENGIFVSIGGSSQPLVDALMKTVEALGFTADQVVATSAAFEAMGASSTVGADGLARIVGTAAEAGAAFDDLAGQARLATDSMAQMGGVMGGGGGGGAGGFGAMLGTVGMSGGLLGALGSFSDVVMGAINPMMNFIQQAGSMVAGLVGFSVLNDVVQEVQNFTDSLIELNIQTEKNQFAWRYLYGGGNTPAGIQTAQQMADWTKKFSMQIPYTRQDLLNAITTLAPAGLSSQGLEHYMPMIADLAATRDPNASLAQVAQVIMGASMGYTRMLKYDLKINPEDLIQYGLNATGTGTGIHINDPQTLLPALENYSKAKGLTGAAKDISHETWWGSWSSFIDRIQNFELDTGKGLFGSLKTSLNDLSSWIDAHSDQISRFSDLIGNTLAGAFKIVTGVVGDFLTGVGQSGLFAGLQDVFGVSATNPAATNAAAATKGATGASGKTGIAAKGTGLASEGPHGKTQFGTTPPVEMKPPENLSAWQQAGQVIGTALKEIGEGWNAVSDFMKPYVALALQDLGTAWKNFTDSLTPEDKETIKEIGLALMSIPWLTLIGFIEMLVKGLEFLKWILDNIIHPLEHFANLMNGIGDVLGFAKKQFKLWADDLKTKALTWGSDFIGNLASGMLSAAGGVLTNALGSIGQTIKDHLGHSAPTSGPLVGDDQWMPDMMTMFARQIHAGTTQIGSAMNGVANTMVQSMTPRGGYGAVGSAGVPAGATVINIYGNGTEEMMKVIDYASSRKAVRVNRAIRASGGYGAYQVGTLGGLR